MSTIKLAQVIAVVNSPLPAASNFSSREVVLNIQGDKVNILLASHGKYHNLTIEDLATPTLHSLHKPSYMTSMQLHQTQTLRVFANPRDADLGTVTWSSSDDTIATVDSDGVVTPVAGGIAVITATAGSHTATFDVTIAAPAAVDVPLNIDNNLIAASITFTGKEGTGVAHVHNPKAIRHATLSLDGTTTGLDNGDLVEVTIKADPGYIPSSSTASVTVKGLTAKLTGITIGGSDTATVGINEQYTVSSVPAHAPMGIPTWSVTPASVATIDNKGRLTPVSAGTAKVTAVVDGITASKDVVVAASSVVTTGTLTLSDGDTLVLSDGSDLTIKG